MMGKRTVERHLTDQPVTGSSSDPIFQPNALHLINPTPGSSRCPIDCQPASSMSSSSAATPYAEQAPCQEPRGTRRTAGGARPAPGICQPEPARTGREQRVSASHPGDGTGTSAGLCRCRMDARTPDSRPRTSRGGNSIFVHRGYQPLYLLVMALGHLRMEQHRGFLGGLQDRRGRPPTARCPRNDLDPLIVFRHKPVLGDIPKPPSARANVSGRNRGQSIWGVVRHPRPAVWQSAALPACFGRF